MADNDQQNDNSQEKDDNSPIIDQINKEFDKDRRRKVKEKAKTILAKIAEAEKTIKLERIELDKLMKDYDAGLI